MSEQTSSHIRRGTIFVHPRGFGFVSSEGSDDIFIPKDSTANAMDGDTVEAEVTSRSAKGLEGVVLSIIKRGREEIVGTVCRLFDKTALVVCPMLGPGKTVEIKKPKKLSVGDRIVMQLGDRTSGDAGPLCSFKYSLGSIDDASRDIACSLIEYGLSSTFTEEQLQAAASFGETIPEGPHPGREDLRHLDCFTIDPASARDFDDALSIEKKGELTELGVHIADVAHYIKPHSPLDLEAKIRCNSTYFPGECVPMLPEALSNGLCSLRPNVDRMTMSVFMVFDESGELKSHRIVRGIIHSKRRFTYEEAKEILDGKASDRFEKEIQAMHALASKLRQARRERGSVEFAAKEAVINIDAGGMPTGITYVEHDISHQLVEEFMIKANAVVAGHLTQKQKRTIYRIHEEPDEGSREDFVRMANLLGYKIPGNPSPEQIQEVLNSERDTAAGMQLAISYIRSMKLAVYTPDNIGHFGLSLEHYCHFTSPIRRYPDLIVQRILFDENDKNASLDQICETCSKQERISARAEGSVTHLKKLRLAKKLYKQDPKKTYRGLIKEVKPAGIVFSIEEVATEGFLPIGALCPEFLTYNPRAAALESKSYSFALFSPIEVQIERVDLINSKCRWQIAR